jgi:hypothetical protein
VNFALFPRPSPAPIIQAGYLMDNLPSPTILILKGPHDPLQLRH